MPARRRLLLHATAALVTAVASLATSGCGLFGRDDPTVGRTSPRPTTPTITVLDAGSEPRRVVELGLEPDATSEISIAVDLHLTQRTSDAEEPQVLDPPTTTQTVRFTVESADETGAEVAFEVIAAGIDPADTPLTEEQVAQLTARVQEVVGLRGRMTVDRSGRLTALAYEGPSGLSDEGRAALTSLEGSLASVVPALPTEPIGRGARWRTVTRSTTGGLAVRQTTTYEVTAIEDDRLLYRATVAQDAAEQDLPEDGGGAATGGSTARLLAADLVGTTTGAFSLTSPGSESETTIRGSQVVEQEVDGETVRSTHEIAITTRVAPAG